MHVLVREKEHVLTMKVTLAMDLAQEKGHVLKIKVTLAMILVLE